MESQYTFGSWIDPTIILLQLFITLTFLFFGWRRAYQIWLFWRLRKRGPIKNFTTDKKAMADATVCIQCPIYNEPEVIIELLEHVSEIQWPKGKLEIQVLDDSDDQTTSLVRNWLRLHPEHASYIKLLRRENLREGYKAGALSYGLTKTKADFIAIFDADFRPEPHFLERLMMRFADSQIAAVQARWAFSNRTSSWLSLLQAALLEPHFFVEQPSRSHNELFITFNGTAGIWRRKSIEKAGGWSHDTVTEDLDLSCRVQLRGEKIYYDSSYSVKSELPPTLTAFKAQQSRWTKGTVQTFRKFILTILSSSQPLRVKMESLHQLGIGLFHPILVIAILLNVPTFLLQTTTPNMPLGFAQVIMTLLTCGSALTYFFMGQYLHHRSWPKAIGMLLASPLILSISMAMCLTTGIASLRGLFEKGGEFVRTPKGSLAQNTSLLWKKALHIDFLLPLLGEFVIGIALFLFAGHLLGQDYHVTAALFGIQSAGLLLFGVTTLSERLRSLGITKPYERPRHVSEAVKT